jgi:hypothetical protein
LLIDDLLAKQQTKIVKLKGDRVHKTYFNEHELSVLSKGHAL